MHVLVVFCHPEPGSFNGALKDLAVETFNRLGHTAEVADLHAEGFDPVERARHYARREDPDRFNAMNEQRHAGLTDTLPGDVAQEIERLERADLVVLQFPLWWHAQPAMLKGWFDRVFVNGRLYTSTMRYDRGYFRGRKAICSVTTGAPEAAFQGNGRGGNIDVMMWPIHYSLYYMGFTVLTPFLSFGINDHTGYTRIEGDGFVRHIEERMAAWKRTLETVDEADAISFPGWDDWDEFGHQTPPGPGPRSTASPR